MEQGDARGAERFLIVAILGAKVDHRAESVLPSEVGGLVRREGSADREALGEPMEVRLAHQLLIFLPRFIIIFFISDSQWPSRGHNYCCFDSVLLLFQQSMMEQQSFTTVPPTI